MSFAFNFVSVFANASIFSFAYVNKNIKSLYLSKMKTINPSIKLSGAIGSYQSKLTDWFLYDGITGR